MVDKTDVEPGGGGSGGAAYALRTNSEPVIGLKDRTPLIEVEGIAAGKNLIIKDLPTEVILPALLRRTLTVSPNTAKDINKSKILIDAWNAKEIKLYADGLPVLTYPPLAVIIPKVKVTTGGTGGTGGTGSTGGPLAPTGVSPGTYNNTTLTVAADGRLTFAANGLPPAPISSVVLAGDVTGPSSSNQLSATGVTAGIYFAPTVTVDAKGRVLSITSTTPGGITASQHEALFQLIHFLSDGPGKGFLTGAFKETLPIASPFPTSVIWWVDATKTVRIVEKLITYTGILPTTIVWNVYNAIDVLQESATDVIIYSGVFEISRTRTIV